LQRLAEHVLIERQVGDEAFEAAMFVLALPHAPQLTDAQMGELFLPDVARRLAHAELPTHVGDGRAGLRLAQRIRDLLFTEFRTLHGPASLGWPAKPSNL